MIGCQYNNLAG